MTTAYCCPSGYTLAKPEIIGMLTGSACSAAFPAGGPAANIPIVQTPDFANSAPSTQTFELEHVVQPTWHVMAYVELGVGHAHPTGCFGW